MLGVLAEQLLEAQEVRGAPQEVRGAPPEVRGAPPEAQDALALVVFRAAVLPGSALGGWLRVRGAVVPSLGAAGLPHPRRGVPGGRSRAGQLARRRPA